MFKRRMAGLGAFILAFGTVSAQFLLGGKEMSPVFILIFFSVSAFISVLLCLLTRHFGAAGIFAVFLCVFFGAAFAYLSCRGLLQTGEQWVFLLFADWAGAAAACVFLALRDKRGRFDDFPAFFRPASRVFLLTYTALMIYALFFLPERGAYADVNLVPFATIKLFWGVLHSQTYGIAALRNLLGNVILFIPPGFYLGVLVPREKKVLPFLFMPLITLSIEALQYVFHAGSADIDDVILNLLGMLLGFALCRVTDRIYAAGRRRRTARLFTFDSPQKRRKD